MLAISYFNMADNYNFLEESEKAYEAYQKGRKICELNQEVNPLDEANGFRTGGRIFVTKKKYQKANALFFKALAMYRDEVEEHHPKIRQIMLEIADSYSQMGDRANQLKMYYKALNQYFSSQSADTTDLGRINLELARYYAATKYDDSTRKYVDKCLDLFCYSMIESDFSELPEWSKMAFPQKMVEVLKLNADLQLNQEEPNQKVLEKGLRSYLLAAQLIDSIRFNQVSFSGKVDLGAMAVSIYEGGIKAAFHLEKQTGNPDFFDQAFSFAERGKSNHLYQSIQEAEARISAGIPDSMFTLEAEIKISLMFYRNKILEESAKLKGKDLKKIKLWQEKVFRLTREKDSLITRLEKDYPRYFELKYAIEVPEVKEVQILLKKNNASLLSYFEGEENLFIFDVSASQKQLFLIEKNPLLDLWIDSFRTSIYLPFTGGAQEDSLTNVLRNNYAYYGHKLFQYLFPANWQPKPDSRLIIIPDGKLGHLPFEGLLTEPPERPGRYRSYPYLIKSVSVAYAYSTALLFHDYKARQFPLPEKKLIAFSPGFKQSEGEMIAASRSELGELAFSKSEVEAVRKSLGGDLWLDEEATEERFKSIAGEYQMIHISSHAMVNDEKPMQSQIAFSISPDTTDDDFLSLEELFHLKLPAEMVVLSACETGIGKLFRGEGISSLARGFSYAGARSIITTLWKVNDESTSKIMAGFYENLNQGMNKDEALRQSKLSYLETANNLTAHPFYWSGYVPIGNMGPVDGGGFSWWWLIVLGGVMHGRLETL